MIIIIILMLYCKNHYHDELYCEAPVHPAGTAAVQEEEELRPKSSQSTGRERESDATWIVSRIKFSSTLFFLWPRASLPKIIL